MMDEIRYNRRLCKAPYDRPDPLRLIVRHLKSRQLMADGYNIMAHLPRAADRHAS